MVADIDTVLFVNSGVLVQREGIPCDVLFGWTKIVQLRKKKDGPLKKLEN